MSSKTLPSPVGGWNTKNSLADMRPDEASVLDNIFPGEGRCTIRRGYTSWATGLGDNVDTLLELNAGGVRLFVGAANNKLWDITTTGAGTDITAALTITNDQWQWAQFDDASGGARVGLVNGSDVPLQIKNSGGAAVAEAMTILSGPTAINVIGINIFKSRSYFWEDGSQSFWYSAVNALGGTLTEFPLGRVQGTGGDIKAMTTWTIDGGAGLQDLAVFILNNGDVVIYNGSNPGNASDWALVGIFKIGPPLSIRGMIQTGGDVLVLSQDGYIPLSKNLEAARVTTVEISDAINPTVKTSALNGSAFFGWQALHYPKGGQLIVNVPISANEFVQHVLNTQTGAWCRFTGMKAYTWGLFSDNLYFGSSGGVVYRADNGFTDGGNPVQTDAQQAWTDMGAPGRIKKWNAARPNFLANGNFVGHAFAIGVDYERGIAVPVPAAGSKVSTDWGAAWGSPWDGGEINAHGDWEILEGEGHVASLRLRAINASQDIQWISTNYLYDLGGPL